MTLFFKNYSRAELAAVRKEIIGIKLYPAGITTRSESGVGDFDSIDQTLALMEEMQIPLLVHGESGGFVLDREKEFLTVYQRLAESFPGLHIVMEHITTAAAVDFIDCYTNVSATVTLHHLLIMFGSDSAPHPRHKKECCGCAAGIFSAPVALPMLAEIFEDAGRLDLLQSFVSDIACNRYGLQPPAKRIIVEKKPWQVPHLYGKVKQPFGAGKTLRWSIAA